MKKICTILLFCLTSFSYAQNLAFSRIIDTVLVLNIGTNITDISTKYIGATISPASGKVWKINNVLLDAGYVLQDAPNQIWNCFFCNDPNQDRNDIKFGVDIYDGVNDIDISLRSPSVNGQAYHSEGYVSQNDFPLWINSSSTIRTFMIQNIDSQVSTGLYEICVRNVFAKAYVSIIEFNE